MRDDILDNRPHSHTTWSPNRTWT